MNSNPETELVITTDGDGVRITTRAAARRSAQLEARTYVPSGVSMVEELLSDRRREARLEEEQQRFTENPWQRPLA
jgi:hypothetical protein